MFPSPARGLPAVGLPALVAAGVLAVTAALLCCALGAALLAGAATLVAGASASPVNDGATVIGGGTVAPGTVSAAAGVAVDWALAQVGTPYVWGGETPGVGFDCSGLVQAAYERAGIALPRVAQDQYDAGPHVPTGSSLMPGDLVFFGSSPAAVAHVGMVVGTSGGRLLMVDAPHTGADVRVEPFPSIAGAPWGTERFVGATRPAAGKW